MGMTNQQPYRVPAYSFPGGYGTTVPPVGTIPNLGWHFRLVGASGNTCYFNINGTRYYTVMQDK